MHSTKIARNGSDLHCGVSLRSQPIDRRTGSRKDLGEKYGDIYSVSHLLFVEAVNMENSHLLHDRALSTLTRTLERTLFQIRTVYNKKHRIEERGNDLRIQRNLSTVRERDETSYQAEVVCEWLCRQLCLA